MADVETKAYQLFAEVMKHENRVMGIARDKDLTLTEYMDECEYADDKLWAAAREIWNE